MKDLLNPKIDYVFKRIFSHEGSEDVTKALLECIMKKEISSLELNKSTILEKELADDKVGILDIRAKIDNSINCNIEMQIANRKNLEKRILFYWSKIYTQSIYSGKNYSSLEKTVSIIFVDFELDNLKEIPKYATRWNIREEEFSKTILTGVMEIYIIELPKFKKYENKENTSLNSWIKFINNPEVISMNEKNKEIKKAKEILEKISEDEHERELAEYREKYIMDQMAIEDYGFDRGVKESKRQIVINLAKKDIKIEDICEIVELSKDEVKEILNQ